MKATYFIIRASLGALLLSGCSHFGGSDRRAATAQSDPQRTLSQHSADPFSEGDFVRAVYGADNVGQALVTTERHFAVPLPGQLKPVEPREARRGVSRAPDAATAVAEARLAALQAPTEDGFVNAVQVYPYAPGSLYRVFTAPEQVTGIALEPGEALVSVSAGDTARWVLGDTTSGTGETEQVHILVKPIEAGLSTNALIATDRRTYHLEMESFDETYMAAVSWRYPQSELVRRKRRSKPSLQKASARAPGFAVERLNFGYEITGDTPDWRPVRALDDGRKTFIEFPESIASSEAPPLFVLKGDDEPSLVNYRMKGRWYEVDSLFDAAELRIGKDDAQTVRVTRKPQRMPKRSFLAGLFGNDR